MLWVLLVIVVLIAVYGIATYNSFVRLSSQVDEAFATMDVYLKKRYDLIPNLVEVVKKYAAHEADTLTSVVQARNAAMGANGIAAREQAEAELSTGLKNIFALAESYPELRSSDNYAALQEQLTTTEEDIASARKYYNAVVKNLNSKLMMFPASFIAGTFGFQPREFFMVSSPEERENVKVQL